jgi:hypothetical protein
MDTPGKPEKGSWLTNKTFLAFFGTLFALIFITLMIVISVATQVEDIDEKLKYIPPQTIAAEITPKAVVAGQMVYVPIYSHIYAKGGKPFLLEATLSVRNSDPKEEITIASVRYYDTNGNLIKDYLEKLVLLKPLATAEFLVAQKEIKGGSGANFIVEWVSDTKVNQPVIEAVMIGIEGQTSISFVRTGVAIDKQ